MFDLLKERIGKQGFSDYLITGITTHEYQRYLLKNGVESDREIHTRSYQVTVYLDQTIDGRTTRGDFTFYLQSGQDPDFYLSQARVGASLVHNRGYRLMTPQTYPDVILMDPRIKSARAQADMLTQLIRQNSGRDSSCRSSAELFLVHSEIELQSSTGIRATKEKSRIEVDFTIVSEAAGQSAEIHGNVVRRNFDQLNLTGLLADHERYSRDMLRVQVPPSGQATVLFAHDQIRSLFQPLIYHSSARIKDLGLNKFEIGTAVWEPTPASDFQLISNGLIPFGLYSDPFDEEGIPGRELVVIDHGGLLRFLASKQYADYLGLEPTGGFKNMIIQPVAPSINLDEEFLQVVKFSDFSPDPVTGDFVAEIRFGYLFRHGQRIPVKGGSISGNLFKCLPKMSFDSDSIISGDYAGPGRIAVRDLQIAGA